MKNSLMRVIVIGVILLLPLVGCSEGLTPPPTLVPPIPSPTSPLTPTPDVSNASWDGTTDQGWPVTFEVANGMIRHVSFAIDLSCQDEGWTANSNIEGLAIDIPLPGEGEGFSLSTTTPGGGYHVTIAGTRVGDAIVGTIAVAHTHPDLGSTAVATVAYHAYPLPAFDTHPVTPDNGMTG